MDDNPFNTEWNNDAAEYEAERARTTCPSCRATDDHAAREAEIRQRIAVEVKREISRMNAFWGPQVPRDFRWGYERGMYCVLGIIERGAQPEGEQT